MSLYANSYYRMRCTYNNSCIYIQTMLIPKTVNKLTIASIYSHLPHLQLGESLLGGEIHNAVVEKD